VALQNLQKDFERIFEQIFRKGDKKNPFREFMAKYDHVFHLNYNDCVKQLKEIQSSETVTGKPAYQLFDSSYDSTIKAVASEFIGKWGALGNKKTSNYVQTVTKEGNNVKVVITLNEEKTQNVYKILEKYKKDISAEVFSKGNGKKLFDIILEGGRGKAGGNVAMGSVFNIGHEDAIGRYKGSVLAGAAGSLETPEIIDDVVDRIATDISSKLSDAGLEMFAVDNFITFANGQMIQNPQGSYKIMTNLETDFNNQILAQRKDGAEQGSAKQGQELGKIRDHIRKVIADEIAKEKNWSERKGSNSFQDTLAQGIMFNPNLRKFYKGKIRYTGSFKGIGKNRDNQSTTKKKKFRGGVKNYNVFKAGLGKIPQSLRKKKQLVEKGTANIVTPEAAFTTRSFVNSRLTKQVQKNMGRPALENQTGRFAESVNVTNAVPTAKGIHMDYTYNPNYRVFENGSQYPSNFDPRPLIENSIRELAAQKLETKFTLRRV
jgi:hypothetical protein